MSLHGIWRNSGTYSSTSPLPLPRILPKVRLPRSRPILITEFACACSACGRNGLPVPTYAVFVRASKAGVDQTVAPAKSFLGFAGSGSGGRTTHVFFRIVPGGLGPPVRVSMRTKLPWNA